MKLKLKRAQRKHCGLLYRWVNEELVRRNSFNTGSVDYEQHKAWFEKVMQSDASLLYIAYTENGLPVGQIRVDIEDRTGVIDYSIDANHRGKGFGKQLLQLAAHMITDEKADMDELVGRVKYENLPSQKSFDRAGYTAVRKTGFIEYRLSLRNTEKS